MSASWVGDIEISAFAATGVPLPITASFALGSQPRTSTLLTWATALMRARNSIRFTPHTSVVPPASVGSPGSGPSVETGGSLNRSVSPSTRQSKPARTASAYRKSRLDWLTWNTWSCVPSVSSTSVWRPASDASCFAMSDSFTFS